MSDIVFAEDKPREIPLDTGTWKVLIADDEPEVHVITDLTLRGYHFLNKTIELYHAESGQECLDILEQHPDMAVVFLDVVMETNHSGLDVVDHIRTVMGNQALRIIIRTGQPGDFPEEKLMNEYDINEYLEKTDLSARRVRTSLSASLRNYRDLLVIRTSQIALSRIALGTADIIDDRNSTQEFAQGIFDLVQGLFLDPFQPEAPRVLGQRLQFFDEDRQSLPVHSQSQGQDPGELFDRHIASRHSSTYSRGDSQGIIKIWDNNLGFFRLRSGQSHSAELIIQWNQELEAHHIRLLEGLMANLRAAFQNQKLIADLEHHQEKLEESLKEKEILLKEIHHRVKNNLQIISSLLSVESDSLEDPQTIAALQETRSRILSMAMVHEKLYQSKNLALIDLGLYIQSLSEDLAFTFDLAGAMDLDIHQGEVWVPINTAIPCGLLINELITNALKYAYPEGTEKDVIRVSLLRDEGEVVVIVEDRGVGNTAEPLSLRKHTLGKELLKLLTNQIKGRMDWEQNGGTRVSIRFPVEELPET